MDVDTRLLQLGADWCVNLSAGWLGAALIVPAMTDKKENLDWVLFIENILLALVFFFFAYKLISI